MDLRVTERTLELREPLVTSYGTVERRVVFEVTLSDDTGPEGRGEAAPLEAYDGVSDELVRVALKEYAKVLEPLSNAAGPAVMETCRSAADLPQALAAIDLALWDRAARRAGKPVAALLADDHLTQVRCNALMTSLGQAQEAVDMGFDCIKVKVGLGDDARTIAGLRAALGQDVLLRLDANGAWDVDVAVRSIEALAPAGIELVEEPVTGIEQLRAVRERVSTRIAMDETTRQRGALASGAADAVCLKITRAGGIASLLAQAALVRSTGADVYLASTFDGPLGIRAAAHCAAALRCDLPCGLATLGAFDGFKPSGPSIAIDGPGL